MGPETTKAATAMSMMSEAASRKLAAGALDEKRLATFLAIVRTRNRKFCDFSCAVRGRAERREQQVRAVGDAAAGQVRTTWAGAARVGGRSQGLRMGLSGWAGPVPW